MLDFLFSILRSAPAWIPASFVLYSSSSKYFEGRVSVQALRHITVPKETEMSRYTFGPHIKLISTTWIRKNFIRDGIQAW